MTSVSILYFIILYHYLLNGISKFLYCFISTFIEILLLPAVCSHFKKTQFPLNIYLRNANIVFLKKVLHENYARCKSRMQTYRKACYRSPLKNHIHGNDSSWLLLSKLLFPLFKKTDFCSWYSLPSLILTVCGRHIVVSYAIASLAVSEISYFHDDKYT